MDTKKIERKQKEQILNEQYLIGLEYKEKKQYEKAKEYFEKAAPHKDALYELSCIYADGLGVKQDYNQALNYCKKAATLGNKNALFQLGILYETGNIIKKDTKKAIEYYEKAGQLGHPAALYKLGKMYYNGFRTGLLTKQNYKKAIEYLKKAGNLGHAKALRKLSTIYKIGKGVIQNIDIALEYLEQAAELGDKEAQYYLALTYEEGKILRKNNKKAIEYYEKAGKQGHVESLNRLGYIYMYSQLDEKQDLEKAQKYFTQSLKLNSEEAELQLMIINIFKNPETIDYKKLFELKTKQEIEDMSFYIIKSEINTGSPIIEINSLKELTQEKLKEIPENSVIFIKEPKFERVFNNFYTYEDIKKILKIINKITKDIDQTQSEEDIFMQIYIKLAHLLHYDNDAVKKHREQKLITSRNLQILINKKGVCVGYADALKTILEKVGIESKIITSEKHAYIQVKINGKWYYCDPTWDSNKIKQGYIKDCLKSKETFTKNIHHKAEIHQKEEESNEDYENVQELFIRNLYKLSKIDISLLGISIRKKIEESIEHAQIDQGGKTK